jgi:hypothetical protein
MAIAPMDIRKREMRISGMGISFGEASKSVAVTSQAGTLETLSKSFIAFCNESPLAGA